MTNLSRKPRKEDAFDLLARSLSAGSSSAGILAQEADGQRSLVESETLPTNMRGSEDILKTAGVKFLGVVENDPLFQYVELPIGWKKVPTDHSMWTDLVDDKGRKRAAIFYKAAFYDRDAFVNASRRYSISVDYDRLDKEGVAVALVTDGETVIHKTEPIVYAGENGEYDASDKARDLAKTWLAEQYPDWENAAAYWD